MFDLLYLFEYLMRFPQLSENPFFAMNFHTVCNCNWQYLIGNYLSFSLSVPRFQIFTVQIILLPKMSLT